MRISMAELARLQKDGKIAGMEVRDISVRDNDGKKIPKESKEKKWLLTALSDLARIYNVTFDTEHVFDETKERKFRFDYAFIDPETRIAVEYEGIFSEKSRHITLGGFMEDCTKYNLAAVQGWTVLRYHAGNYNQAIDDVSAILTKKLIKRLL